MAQTFKKGKKFAVVAFPLEDNEVAVVPTKWLFQGSSKRSFTCMWPPMLSSLEMKKLVKEAGNPDKKWNWYPVTVLHQCKSYEKAESAMKAHKSKSDFGSVNHEGHVEPSSNQKDSQILSDESSEENPSMEIEKVSFTGAGKRPSFMQQTAVHPSSMQQTAVDIFSVKSEDSDDEAEDSIRAQQNQRNLENSFYHQDNLKITRTRGESQHLSNGIKKMPPMQIEKVSSIKAERRPSFVERTAIEPSSMRRTALESPCMQQNAAEQSSMQRIPVEPSSIHQTLVDTSCARMENSISEKKFAVVELIKDGVIEVIPSIWIISSTKAKYPNIFSVSTIERYKRIAKPYKNEWNSVHIKINAYSNSFKKAMLTASILQNSSDSSSEDENPAPRKKQKPARYASPIEMEEESESEEHPLANLSTDVETSKKNSDLPDLSQMNDLMSVPLLNQILQYLISFDQSLKELHLETVRVSQKLDKLVNSGSEKIPTFHELPSSLQLPVSSEVELYDLNENLKNDKEKCAILVRYLNSVGCGKTPSSFVLSLTKKILTAEVATLYSRYGRKGKKSFVNCHPETFNVILATAALKFKDVGRDALGDMFGKALAGAGDWNGRLPRPSDPGDTITFPRQY